MPSTTAFSPTHLATSIPGIFAAVGVALAWHPRLARRIRLAHWSSALGQGPAAARNMLGITTVYDRVAFLFSDQYDVGMEFTGPDPVSLSRWYAVRVRPMPAAAAASSRGTGPGREVTYS